ncbi:unnamed protein product [Timema podura]|uniref:Uncharacterized protein n=1 Tax=Timema podura TaxID=61482 RepID=A0ABN7P2K4_TIMPD|nr:unnamed protein product [Timema podura]
MASRQGKQGKQCLPLLEDKFKKGKSGGTQVVMQATKLRLLNNRNYARSLAEGVDLSDTDNFFCPGCAYEKNHKLPFNNLNHQKMEFIKIPREVMPRSRQMTNIGITLCRDGALTQYVCLHLMSLVGGFNDFSVNTTSLPVNLGHFPNGASQKTVAHIGQTVMSGRFSQFDYGRNMNLKKYGRPTSPDYDLEAITAPVALYYGDNDLLITPQDIARLFSVLKNSRDRTMKRFYTYSHFDFLWGVNVKSVVYDYILTVIDTYT